MINLKAFEIAKKEIGVKETSGPKSTQRIVEYHSATSLEATSDEVPWCSSFMNWCIMKAGGRPTGSAMARSWLLWGAKVKTPQRGDIVVFSRGNDGVSGHVGFVAETPSAVSPYIKVLGGNQSNQVCVAPYLRARVLGYRRSV